MKIKLLLWSLIVCISTLLAGCSQSDNYVTTDNSESQMVYANADFENLCKSIDRVNSSYQNGITPLFDQTRVSDKTLIKWTKRGCVAIADACTSAFLGFIGGTICSWAYDDYLDYVLKEVEKPVRKIISANHTISTDSIIPSYVYSNGKKERIDSIGYYHNVLLQDLASSNKNYLLLDGNIDYYTLLRDCVTHAKKRGINEYICEADTNRIINFSKAAVSSLVKSTLDCDSLSKTFSLLNEACAPYLNNNDNIERIEAVESKILSVIANVDDESELDKYADEIIKIIEDSKVDNQLKGELKIVTSVSVNSKLYWGNTSSK